MLRKKEKENSSTFQGNWAIFKYFSRQFWFSRTFQDSHSFSSTFQACGNSGLSMLTCPLFKPKYLATGSPCCILGTWDSFNLLKLLRNFLSKVGQCIIYKPPEAVSALSLF